MKSKILRTILLVILFIFFLALSFTKTVQGSLEEPYPEGEILATSTVAQVTYAQGVWISALEWCESRGRPSAINPIDRDGSASYYSFQFKPSTFKSYGVRYGVLQSDRDTAQIMELIKDTELQRQIVSYMVLDPSTNWDQQFPVCVSLIGYPPEY